MPNQNNMPVRLKGVGDSLWVTFDPDLPVERLKKELATIFERIRHLAINARIVLDPGEDRTEEKLIEELGAFLQQEFRVGTFSVPIRNKPQPEVHEVRAKDVGNAWLNYNSDALVIAGRVRSGQKIQAKKHLIILGDLNPGAEAIAGGDIIILGSLLGTAAAGQPDNEESIIMAMDFRPTQVQIGGFVAAGTSASAGNIPEFAQVENNAIVVLDYLKASPFKRMAWPEVR